MIQVPRKYSTFNVTYHPSVLNVQHGDGFLDFLKNVGRRFKPIAKNILESDIAQDLINKGKQSIMDRIPNSLRPFVEKYGPVVLQELKSRGMNYIKRKYKGAGANQENQMHPMDKLRRRIYLSDLKRKNTGKGYKIAGNGYKIAGDGLRVAGKRVAQMLSRQFVPMMIDKMRGSGMEQVRPISDADINQLEKKIFRVMSAQNGGAIGAVLSGIASALPTIIEVGKQAFPYIKKAFSWIADKLFPSRVRNRLAKQRAMEGHGMAINKLGSEMLDFLKIASRIPPNQMNGAGFLDFFKNIGRKFIPIAKKIFKSDITKNVINQGTQRIMKRLPSAIRPYVEQYGPKILEQAKKHGMPFVRSRFNL